jgi:hypothetical protein
MTESFIRVPIEGRIDLEKLQHVVLTLRLDAPQQPFLVQLYFIKAYYYLCCNLIFWKMHVFE